MTTTGLAKMRKDVSEYIVAHVLNYSDVLIRGSQKRQNQDNELRQELWSNLADQIVKLFDCSPMEPEKVKQHFHNRRKAVMGRVRDDLRRNGLENVSLEEKMEWIRNRRIVPNDYDLQIVEFFLTKEEERGATPANQSQTNHEIDADPLAFLNGLISKEPPTNIIVENVTDNDPVREISPVFEEQNPITHSFNENSSTSSQLIVEVLGKSELKRLLNLLIDNGFYRFTHIDDQPHLSSSVSSKGTKRPIPGSLNEFSLPEKRSLRTEEFEAACSSSPPINPHENRNIFEPSTSSALILKMAETKQEENDEDDFNSETGLDIVNILTSNKSETKKRKEKFDEIQFSAKCEMCLNIIRLNSSGSRWNLYEHVVLNHSDYRPFQCPQCSYSGVRKSRLKQHILAAHGSQEEPLNVVTKEIREHWDERMALCFPNHNPISNAFPKTL